MRLAGRRLITALTLTAAAAAGAVLATSAQTAALASKPACSAPAAHRGHRSQACSRSRHAQTTRPHATTRKHTHSGATGAKGAHRGKRHTVKRKATKARARPPAKPSAKPPPAQPRPRAKTAAPRRVRATDSFTCDDGSEPDCENGSVPIVAANGSTLLCNSPASKRRRLEPASRPVRSRRSRLRRRDAPRPAGRRVRLRRRLGTELRRRRLPDGCKRRLEARLHDRRSRRVGRGRAPALATTSGQEDQARPLRSGLQLSRQQAAARQRLVDGPPGASRGAVEHDRLRREAQARRGGQRADARTARERPGRDRARATRASVMWPRKRRRSRLPGRRLA